MKFALTVIKFVGDFRQVDGFLRVLLQQQKILPPRYNWNIVESGIKHYKSTKSTIIAK